MNTSKVRGRNNPPPRELANYFGLTVEIVFRMRNYSLILWRDRESIVDTADLRLMTERRAA